MYVQISARPVIQAVSCIVDSFFIRTDTNAEYELYHNVKFYQFHTISHHICIYIWKYIYKNNDSFYTSLSYITNGRPGVKWWIKFGRIDYTVTYVSWSLYLVFSCACCVQIHRKNTFNSSTTDLTTLLYTIQNRLQKINTNRWLLAYI